MQRAQLLGLYKRILRNAKAFPSVRRDRMVQEIREGASHAARIPFSDVSAGLLACVAVRQTDRPIDSTTHHHPVIYTPQQSSASTPRRRTRPRSRSTRRPRSGASRSCRRTRACRTRRPTGRSRWRVRTESLGVLDERRGILLATLFIHKSSTAIHPSEPPPFSTRQSTDMPLGGLSEDKMEERIRRRAPQGTVPPSARG
jgi:hypothetical protein